MSPLDKDADETLSTLVEVGIALTAENDLDRLLERVVTEARAATHADAGSLYLREGDTLKFVVSQNDTLAARLGSEGERALFTPFTLPIASSSIAGYVAKTGQVLNLDDVYAIPADREYRFNKDFDQRNDYRTRSSLSVPLLDPGGHVIGVLSLLNRMDSTGAATPFRPKDVRLILALASLAAVAVKNAKLSTSLRNAHLDTIFRLSVAAEYRDWDTAGHIRRISDYSIQIARDLGLAPQEIEVLRYASPMHDVGKIGVPDAILLKPAKLTPDERTIMEQHTTIGARILANSESEILRNSESVAQHHHEKWDGTGYPNRLKGEAIPRFGRIVAVADVFDALLSRRCYKPPLPPEKALEILKEGRGTHFDPAVIDVFFAKVDAHLAIGSRYKAESAGEPGSGDSWGEIGLGIRR
ncbi:MAG: GAF domain-containing protein [Planctomycetes bacterium]|nr:GAF domain-containing protein [Planctomycetota bacterium]